jgi:hypothetical protein
MSENPQSELKTVLLHSAAHVIGAIAFAGMALGFGLAIGGFVAPPARQCVPAPVELTAKLDPSRINTVMADRSIL